MKSKADIELALRLLESVKNHPKLRPDELMAHHAIIPTDNDSTLYE